MSSRDFLPIVLACAMLVSGTTKAQDGNEVRRPARESIFETQYSCKAKGRDDSLHTEDLTVLGFAIGASTIRDIQKRFPRIRPVELAHRDEAEKGICIKNAQGLAAVFATSVMGSPDTLVAIYLSPSDVVETSRLACTTVQLPSKDFSSASGIRVGAGAPDIAKILRGKVPANGAFCTAYQIASSRGPLQFSKRPTAKAHEFTDFTGAEGQTKNGKLEWIKLFGIASE